MPYPEPMFYLLHNTTDHDPAIALVVFEKLDLDYKLAAVLRRYPLLPSRNSEWSDLYNFPAFHSLSKRIFGRPATSVAKTAERLSPTPLTKPQHATPPKGSAH